MYILTLVALSIVFIGGMGMWFYWIKKVLSP